MQTKQGLQWRMVAGALVAADRHVGCAVLRVQRSSQSSHFRPSIVLPSTRTLRLLFFLCSVAKFIAASRYEPGSLVFAVQLPLIQIQRPSTPVVSRVVSSWFNLQPSTPGG